MMVKVMHTAESGSFSSSIACGIFRFPLPAEAVPNSYCKLAQCLKVIQKKRVSMHPTYCTFTHIFSDTRGFLSFKLVRRHMQSFKGLHLKLAFKTFMHSTLAGLFFFFLSDSAGTLALHHISIGSACVTFD